MSTSLPSSSHDLKASLYRSLEDRGALNEIRARIRAEIFQSIDNPQSLHLRPPSLALSNEDLLVFEMVREWLECHGLHQTLSVLVAESGQSIETLFDRDFIRSEVGLAATGTARAVADASTTTLPLLNQLVIDTQRRASQQTITPAALLTSSQSQSQSMSDRFGGARTSNR